MSVSSLIHLRFAAIASAADERPNILLCISDDQSWSHSGANGDPVVQTPAFDRIAREGIRFTHIPFDEVDPSSIKMLIMKSRQQHQNLYDLAFAKRLAVELYDIAKDPG